MTMTKFIKLNTMDETSKKACKTTSYFNADNIVYFREAGATETRVYKSKVSEVVVKTGSGTRTYTVKQTPEEIYDMICSERGDDNV